MAQLHDDSTDKTVSAGMERVLNVELDGVREFERSQQRAQELLAAARVRAAGIERRTDDRIARLHTTFHDKIHREVRGLEAAAGIGISDECFRRTTLEEAANRVAAKLTGEA